MSDSTTALRATTDTPRQAAARSVVWTLLESVGLSGLSLVCLVVISRYLTPAEFGIAAVALGIVQLAVAVVERLFHDPLVQRPELSDAERDSAFTATLLLGAALSLACWLAGPWLAQRVGQAEAAPVLQWMGLSIVATGVGSVVVALHRRVLAFRPLALRSLAARALSALVAIGMAIAGAGVWSLVAQQLLIVGLASAAVWMLSAVPRPRFGWDTGALRGLLRIGLPAIGMQLAHIATPRIFIVMVGAMLGVSAAGHLSMAFRVVDMLRDLFAAAVSQLALPLFAQVERDGRDRRGVMITAMRLTTALMFPLFTGLAVLAPELVEVAFGRQWLPAAPYVALLAMLSWHFFSRMFVGPVLTAIGRPGLSVANPVLQIVFVVGAMAALGAHSPAAAAAIWALRLVIATPLDMWLFKRATGIGAVDQWRGALMPALASLGMAATVWVLGRALRVMLEAPLRLALLSLVGALVYVALLWLIDKGLVREVVAFIGAAARRRRAQ